MHEARTSRRRRIWITGLGLVTPIGIGRAPFWEGVRRGLPAGGAVTRFDASGFRSRVAAEVSVFEATDFMDARTARQTDRFSQFAIAAGRMALEDAALDGAGGRAAATGLYVGSALGGIAYAEEQHARYLERGIRAVAPNLALAVFGGAAPANLGIVLDLRGPIVSNANSCASGAVALGEAARAIRSGEIDVALAGGVETPLSPLAFGAFDVIRALSSRWNDTPARAARPFDTGRDGFVMGEGAALLVLEEARSAQRRGAVPYAELLGYGASSDGYHMVQPRPDGSEAARAITRALTDATVEPDTIDYVNAHATSTPLGDAAEALALARALGPRARTVPVSATKALYGHPLGASGAIEAALCALALRNSWAPPTTNLEQIDDAVSGCLPRLLCEPLCAPLGRVLTTSFGFGGLNAALVMGQPEAA